MLYVQENKVQELFYGSRVAQSELRFKRSHKKQDWIESSLPETQREPITKNQGTLNFGGGGKSASKSSPVVMDTSSSFRAK